MVGGNNIDVTAIIREREETFQSFSLGGSARKILLYRRRSDSRVA